MSNNELTIISKNAFLLKRNCQLHQTKICWHS